MSNRPTGIIILLAALALLPFSEALFSNLGTLSDVPGRAQLASEIGITDQQEIARLLVLTALDTIASIGAIILLAAAMRPGLLPLIPLGQWLTLGGYATYGLYQIISAMTIFAPAFRSIIIIGILYIALGILGYTTGERIKTRA
jgi:hypothetical protein